MFAYIRLQGKEIQEKFNLEKNIIGRFIRSILFDVLTIMPI